VISPLELVQRQRTLASHKIHTLPIVVLMPHSRCNCRCVMCDIWKANTQKREISTEDLERHLDVFSRFRVQRVVLSGGEALLHRNLWALCGLLKGRNCRITLLSTGLLLGKHAVEVARWCDDVIVSLDGSRPVHDSIRRVPRAFDRLAAGVAALKSSTPSFRVTGRSVIQRANFLDMPNIIDAAHALGLDGISFLPADVSSEAFNRPNPWDGERVAEVALSIADVAALRNVVEDLVDKYADDFASGYIAEAPQKLRRLPAYFAAVNGTGAYPETSCNAPWVSTVIEADGTVRPCFFHRSLGNIHDAPLDAILNAPASIAFRRSLDVKRDDTCRRCVCTLQLGPAQRVP